MHLACRQVAVQNPVSFSIILRHRRNLLPAFIFCEMLDSA
jgi:hypothetical protein